MVAAVPALAAAWLLPWALRTTASGGHGGRFTVQHCGMASPITWRCTGSFSAADGMACEDEPGCPTWDPVVLDDPGRLDPGAKVWATKPIGDRGRTVSPWGWREQMLIPGAVVLGLACYLAALATAAWRRLRPLTATAAVASLVLLVPVVAWLPA